MRRRLTIAMALVEIYVSTGERETVLGLVGEALREEIEAMRLASIERQRAVPTQTEEEQAQGFFDDALGLLGSDLVGLFRLFLVEEPESPEKPPEEISGETVDESA